MSTESRVSQEIDEIIARALDEYQNAHPAEEATSQVTASIEEMPVSSDTQITSVDVNDAVDATVETSHDDWVHIIDETGVPQEQEVVHEGTVEGSDLIPENSQSILVSENTSRFSGAIWYDNIQLKDITLAGLGGIGSYVAFLLSRMNPHRIFMYDDDTVEAANMSGQLYGRDAIAQQKVYAISQFMMKYSDYCASAAFNARFSESSIATDIMICGFDNMEARRIFFNKWKEYVDRKSSIENKKKCLFIDGRLAAESLQIFCLTGDDTFNQEKYQREFLFSDEEADETICSYKQTSFMATMIGSLIVNLFVNFCANECDPLIPRDLPFYTEYTAETMFFKVSS